MDKSKKVREFLRESNAIEGVFDEDSLKQAEIAWKYLEEQKELDIQVILRTHRILMLNQRIRGFERGYFRKRPVFIGGKEALHYSEIRGAIKSWLKDVETSIEMPGKNGKHIQLDHITFEKIHPFIDGNGRIGRIFMNWQRKKAGLPILVIKEAEKQKYYDWFTNTLKGD